MTDQFINFFSYQNIENVFKEKVSKTSSKGIDKKSVKNFKVDIENQLNIIQRKIANGSFKFSPFLEILRVKKRNSLPRLLSLPTIRDRIVLSTIKNILHEVFADCVNREMANSYIRKIKIYINKNRKAKIYYIKTDIEKFYDKIDRKILFKVLKIRIKDAAFLKLIRDAIETPTVPANYQKNDFKKNKLYASKKGVPQGLPISNILAQIYLKEFDNAIKGTLRKSLYLRYVDDIIILSKSSCSPLKLSINEELKNIKLKTNKEKTYLGDIENGIDFLSYQIKKNKISINKKTIENQINKIAAKITWFKKGISNPKERPARFVKNTKGFKKLFVDEVNEIITGLKSEKKEYGWLFYYSEITDLSVLYKIDNVIETMFKKLKSFKGHRPKRLKKTVRAYFEIKYSKGGNYISNYSKYNTLNKKRKFLISRARIEPDEVHSDSEIDDIYDNYTNHIQMYLEKDIGYGY